MRQPSTRRAFFEEAVPVEGIETYSSGGFGFVRGRVLGRCVLCGGFHQRPNLLYNVHSLLIPMGGLGRYNHALKPDSNR
jgi:hypothetical protein